MSTQTQFKLKEKLIPFLKKQENKPGGYGDVVSLVGRTLTLDLDDGVTASFEVTLTPEQRIITKIGAKVFFTDEGILADVVESTIKPRVAHSGQTGSMTKPENVIY